MDGARFVKFHRRAPGTPRHLAVFPGSFNPPTQAHVALAQRAIEEMDEVVFVLPEVFPHKDFSGVGFEARLELLLGVARHDRWSVASTAGGLFIDMARELQPHYDGAKLHFLCGRDAAERIVGWHYEGKDALTTMFETFNLLVAARQGHYEPPAEYAAAIARLDLDRDYGEVSATEVRRLLSSGGDWQSLVPPEIQADVLRLYRT